MVAEMRVAAVTIFLFIATANCHNGIPVVIWGNSGSSLSSPLAGHGTSRQEFSKQYLQPLAKLQGHNIVAFIQDRLSLEDLTYHGDVYNSNSDGGHLHNLKTQMEIHPSLHLPSVDSPADAFKSLAAKFSGKVHHLKEPYDLSDLDLDPSGGNLIMAELPKNSGSDAMKAIDSVLGSVSTSMQSKGNKFTAFYTGRQSSQVLESTYTGRHLLQAEAGSLNYTFLNFTGCVFLYATAIEFQLGGASGSKWTLPATDTYDTAKSNCESNGTTPAANITWGYYEPVIDPDNNATLYDMNITASFELQRSGYWRMSELSISYNANGTSADDVDLNVNPASQALIWAPQYYSYHCSELKGIPEAGNGTNKASLFFKGFQVQFQIKSNGQFGPANDCVGFFTIPIWSGLVVTFVLLMVLTFGITMISQINTMDRFDDPKGKTITVNVAE